MDMDQGAMDMDEGATPLFLACVGRRDDIRRGGEVSAL